MNSTLTPISDNNIENQQKIFEENSKLGKFKNQPYLLQGIQNSRDFERLGFYLFKNLLKLDSKIFDSVWLMPGIKDGGRDILLRKSGTTVGIVQCKKYSDKITPSQLLKEIVTLVLQNKDDDILNGQRIIEYQLMTIVGVTEPARQIIDKINNKDFESINEQVQKAIESIIKERKYNIEMLKTRTVNENVAHILLSLQSLIITLMDSEQINDLLEKDFDTAGKFFRLESVIDRSSFEVILSEREVKSLSEYKNWTFLERELERIDKGLTDTFKTIKQKAEKLYDSHGVNFLVYCDHRKVHGPWMLQIASSMLGNDHQLNADEIFVLLASLYLSDIGVCQTLYNMDELSFNKTHHELSSQFIKEFGDTMLAIPAKYIHPISAVVLATNGSLVHPEGRNNYTTNFSAEPFSVNKLNLLYISTIVWLADIIDLQNLTSKSLLRPYQLYPNYGLSTSIWDETDFKFNCDVVDQTLLLKANLSFDDQLIYLGLHKRVESIKGVIQTANAILNKESKNLRLKFVSDDFQSVFKRKIGITVDANIILTTLLGKKLYANETDAIREVIQNALDACTYARSVNHLHQGRIDVHFSQGKLEVIDNGIGMDEEIVTNYFAKAGRSYHTEVQNDKVIGRFGIGVFSYFMLGSSFIVQTTKNNECLKFKVDQAAPEMFYFFDDSNITEGTSITFDNLEFPINHFDLKEYLSLTFKYSHIPIFLNDIQVNILEEIPLNDNSLLIQENIKIEHQSYFLENFIAYPIQIDNDEMVGWAGVFMPKETSLNDIRNYFQKGFKYYNKGVFVNGTSHLIGEINFRQGLPLKLDRNNFEVSIEYDRLRDTILKKVYLAAIKNSNMQDAFFTHFFIHNYGGGHSNHSTFYDIHQHLFPFSFQNGNHILLSLEQINNAQADIELVAISNFLNLKLAAQRSTKSNSIIIPVVFIYTDKFYTRYFKNKNFDESMSHDEIDSYHTFKRNKITSFTIPTDAEVRQCQFIQLDNKLLCTFFSHETFFNVNNELIKFYFTACETPEMIGVKRALNQLFAEMGNIFLNAFSDVRGTTKRAPARVLLFNARLKEIFKQTKFSYEINTENFPVWMQKYIVN